MKELPVWSVSFSGLDQEFLVAAKNPIAAIQAAIGVAMKQPGLGYQRLLYQVEHLARAGSVWVD